MRTNTEGDFADLTRSALRLLAVGLAAVFLVPDVAAAQGRGNGRANQPAIPVRGVTSNVATSAPAGASELSAAPIPQFGSWLDDASTPAKGTGYTGIGVGYWRGLGDSSGVAQVDVPVLGFTYGMTNRVQVSATVPFYRATYQGITARGVDDVYLSGKVAAIDPAVTGRFGLAVGGVVEVLSVGRADQSRVQWALPVSVEFRADPVRVYGSTGYFSRGAVFAAGAIEWTASTGTSVTTSLAQSISTASTPVSVSPRNDLREISVFVAHPLSDRLRAYAGVGRTFASGAAGADAMTLSGGISVSFSAAQP